MGKDAKASLPKFDDGKTYLVKGKTLNALTDEIRRNRPLAGKGTSIRETPDGRQVDADLTAMWPKHPWNIYAFGAGWAVYPAGVNGTHHPTMGGVDLRDATPPSVAADGAGDLDLYLEYDADGTSAPGIGGLFHIVNGSQVLSDVVVTTTGGSTEEVTCDPDTGVVTPGHYVFLIGSVRSHRVTAQEMRFSVNFTLCAGGGMTPNGYG